MTQNQYQAQQLPQLLEGLQNKQVNGVLYLDSETNAGEIRTYILVWKDGRMIYGGNTIPEARSLVKMLEQKLSREWISSAVAFALRQASEEKSIRSLLERLVEMHLFTWEQIESVVYNQLIITLEQALPLAGKFRFDSDTQFNFCRGIELSKLMVDISQRQSQWNSLKPLIPSINAVPQLKDNFLQIPDQNVKNHLQEWVDGKRSLIDIAQGLNKDPLSIAKSYLSWVQSGWIVMQDNTTPTNTQIDLPTILSVDDSPVMQKVIQKALAGYCKVIVASNAVDALNLLYHEKVSLLLLDVSMPEIDGLELCRTVRSITQFRNLPIVMVTARDGLFDKVKGKFAGSNEYLTKPFDADKLRQTVSNYINIDSVHSTSNSINSVRSNSN